MTGSRSPRDEAYEMVEGTPQQREVFMNVQRMVIKMYNDWPEDIALSVMGAALGSVCSLIENQYALHAEECEQCTHDIGKEIDLANVFRSNFEYYYSKGKLQLEANKSDAAIMVDRFFHDKEKK
jgi:hypothetical protein